MAWVRFAAWCAAGFVGLEIFSYALHRWVFHGLLWRVHRTHHTARHGKFELNDLFSVGFGGLAIGLLLAGFHAPLGPPWFALGCGITAYGGLYFLIHDIFTHRRYGSFESGNRLLQKLRQAHLRHHQSAERPGQEPYGLFLAPLGGFTAKPVRRQPPATDGRG